jgi:hypothetical protein
MCISSKSEEWKEQGRPNGNGSPEIGANLFYFGEGKTHKKRACPKGVIGQALKTGNPGVYANAARCERANCL